MIGIRHLILDFMQSIWDLRLKIGIRIWELDPEIEIFIAKDMRFLYMGFDLRFAHHYSWHTFDIFNSEQIDCTLIYRGSLCW